MIEADVVVLSYCACMQLTLDNVKDLMYRLRFKHVLSNMTVQYPYKLQRVSTFRAYLRSIKHGYLQLSMAMPDNIRAVMSSAIKQLYDGTMYMYEYYA